jgi:hypothetical protein
MSEDGQVFLPNDFIKKPTVARVFNAGSGGQDNYAADRVVADKILGMSADARKIAGWNRAFLKRAINRAAGSDIRQVIDIGPGIPPTITDTTHQFLMDAHGNGYGLTSKSRDTRVAYVDNDMSVVSYMRGIEPHAIALYGDLARPNELLAHPNLARGIDFSQPVAVVLAAVLHLIPTPTAFEAVEYIKRGLVPGSWLIVSHATADGVDEATARQVQQTYADAGIGPLALRTRDEIGQFFKGWNLLEPGVVDVNEWWPDPRAEKVDSTTKIYGAVAVKPR